MFTHDTEDRPLIVGGGMAGLMLASALGRMGYRSTVLERAQALDEVGAGVQISPRSVQILREIGVIVPLLERAVALQAREVRSWRGDLISRTELGEECEERYGAPYLAVHRADLQNALLGAVPPDTLHLGTVVDSVEETDHGAAVQLEDGTRLGATAVVGADGIRSTVRHSLLADRPVASGFAAYRALVPTMGLSARACEPVVRIWVGSGSHAVVYPIRGGEALNVVAVIPRRGGTEDWTAPARVDELLAAHLGWDELLAGILAEVPVTTAWALHDRDVLHRLSFGTVALIGDAAHPMLPFAAQGVNQALEDAWVLARCLMAPGHTDMRSRLAGYSRLRAPRAAQAQVTSRHLAASLHVPDGPGRDVRDAELLAGAALEHQDSLLAPLGWLPPS